MLENPTDFYSARRSCSRMRLANNRSSSMVKIVPEAKNSKSLHRRNLMSSSSADFHIPRKYSAPIRPDSSQPRRVSIPSAQSRLLRVRRINLVFPDSMSHTDRTAQASDRFSSVPRNSIFTKRQEIHNSLKKSLSNIDLLFL
jgi:hypothetical protein